MGGSAGHIQNLHEDFDLTIGDLKEIMRLSANNKLENVTEKLDGQNLMVTFRNGIIVGSRTTRHLKNYGEEALTIPEMKEYFNGRKYPFMGDIYCDAMRDLQQAIIPRVNTKEEFLNGQVWINLEILCEESENIIHYGYDQLRIHNLLLLDENGKILKSSPPYFISNIIKQQTRFFIDKTNSVNIKKINDINFYINKLPSDNDLTIGEFLEESLIYTLKYYTNKYINKPIDLSCIFDEETFYKNLAKRWIRGIKKPNINQLLKHTSNNLEKVIRLIDNDSIHLRNRSFMSLKSLYVEWEVEVLKNLEGLATTNEQYCVNKISNNINEFLENDARSFNSEITNKTKNIELHKEFYINSKGTLIVPTEGIVFEYKGKKYKISGFFIPILNMINYDKFERHSKTKK